MKRKKGIIALAVALICSTMLFAGCKHRGHKGVFMLDYVSEVLDLTELQEKELDAIRTEIMDKVEEVHTNHDSLRDQFKAQLSSEAIDKDVIYDLLTEHRKSKDAVVELAIDRLIDFHSTLSAEQREKLVTKLEKFEEHHKSKWQH